METRCEVRYLMKNGTCHPNSPYPATADNPKLCAVKSRSESLRVPPRVVRTSFHFTNCEFDHVRCWSTARSIVSPVPMLVTAIVHNHPKGSRGNNNHQRHEHVPLYCSSHGDSQHGQRLQCEKSLWNWIDRSDSGRYPHFVYSLEDWTSLY